MNEFQIVLISTEDEKAEPGFFTNILSEPLTLEGEWLVCLESIIIPDLKQPQIVIVTIDCTSGRNNSDIIAFFKYKEGPTPEFTRIWQKVEDNYIHFLSIRIQDVRGRILRTTDNHIVAVLKFIKNGTNTH